MTSVASILMFLGTARTQSVCTARLVQRRETRHCVRHVVSGVAHVEGRWTVDALGPTALLEYTLVVPLIPE